MTGSGSKTPKSKDRTRQSKAGNSENRNMHLIFIFAAALGFLILIPIMMPPGLDDSRAFKKLAAAHVTIIEKNSAWPYI
jgi:hypothetical protein